MEELRNLADLNVLVVVTMLLISWMAAASAQDSSAWTTTTWADAHATFYGGEDASGTMGGSCGYADPFALGYGTSTAALSSALFNNGLTCGACFQIVCNLAQTTWCYPGKSITVTATNYCPQGSFGGWCDTPKVHFDLAYPMFTALAQDVGGVIPVQYRRVPCHKLGGIRFTLNGNNWWLSILVTNVGGGGDVAALAVRGDTTNWYAMTQGWGMNWELSGRPELVGQPLCFRVTLGNNQTNYFYHTAPSTWAFGQTFETGYNFWGL